MNQPTDQELQMQEEIIIEENTVTDKSNSIEFNLESAKDEINQLLLQYRTRKDELEWVSDDWEESEIQEELDAYAKKIKSIKMQIKEHEKIAVA
ncbi:MAG: hypothetical protein KAG56_06480 [Sulfurovaceae bacterium]|nr:hypothetical protein [Sulfurovaceae bacterium]